MYDLILKKRSIFKLKDVVKKLDLIKGFAASENKVEFLISSIFDNLEVIDDEITDLLREIYTDVDFENISAVEYLVYINQVFEANQSFFTKVRSDLTSKMK